MYVLQHTRQNYGMGHDMGEQQRRTSVASAYSSMSELSDAGVHQQQSGPYMEGNMKLLATIECSVGVMCNRFSEDGSLLAVGLIDGSIKIYEIDPLTCHCLHSLQDDETIKAKLPVTQIRFKHFEQADKPEHKKIIMASYASGLIKFWHYTSGKCLHTVEVRDEENEKKPAQLFTLATNPENTLFCTTGDDPRIQIYDINTMQRVTTLEASDSRDNMDGHKCRVFALVYHPTIPHVFLSGGWDDTVQVHRHRWLNRYVTMVNIDRALDKFWDDRKRHAYQKISGPHICGDAIDIDPRHNHILTGSWSTDTSLQIWDFNTAQLIKNLPPEPLNNTMVYCCQWLGNDSIICGGTKHNMARIIDRGTLNTTGQLLDLKQSVYCLDNDHHTNHPKVAIGSQNYIYIVRGEKKSG